MLFADVKGSMDLAGQLDPEQWHRILDHFFQILADGVHRFDDLHWIDPASDAFVAQRVEATAENRRNLLLLNFRPEYTARWMRRAHYQQLPLVPLPPEALQVLLNSLLGRDPKNKEKVVARGSPRFP